MPGPVAMSFAPDAGGAVSRTILVVEDDRAIRETLRGVLEDEGYAVEVAEDGEVALVRIREAPPALIVLDIGLPLVDGFGVAEGAQKLYGQSVPIIVITAAGRAGEAAERIGAFAFLAKPFDLDRLLNLVERVVGKP